LEGKKKATDKKMLEGYIVPENIGVTKEQLARYCLQSETLKDYMPDNSTSVNKEFLIRIISAHE
jgi:hypothetical protein